MTLWSNNSLKYCIRRIHNEIRAYEGRWNLTRVNLGRGVTSEIRLTTPERAGPQRTRRYNINLNVDDPLGYKIVGITDSKLVAIGAVHEKTHALCDLSYTCNKSVSMLGTWNSELNEYADTSNECMCANIRIRELGFYLDADTSFNKRIGKVWEMDRRLRREVEKTISLKDVMFNRLAYAGNMKDIDTVISELVLVCSFANIPKTSIAMRYLIDTANKQQMERKLGRFLQNNTRLYSRGS